MKSISVQYNFLVFLYAYLRLIDLSIDRTRWGSWSNLRTYFQSQLQFSVTEVINEILKIQELEKDKSSVVICFEEPTLFKKIKEFIFRLVRKHYLSDVDVLSCCQMLEQFNDLLNNDFSNYPSEAEKIRIEISKFYSYILEPKINRLDLERAMKIEHFMQNKTLKLFKIEDFAKKVLLR